jgi:hypothetical protein
MTVTLIGGEMPGWSDATPGEAAAAAHLAALCGAGGRVLVAGPHHPGVAAALAASGAAVTQLVRSLADAEALTGDVRCGTLPKLAADGEFDAVVALDGVGRLCSVEGPQLGFAESVAALRRALRPGGRLLLAVENDLGLHRLVARTAPEEPWTATDRPDNVSRVAAVLAAEELPVRRLWTAWPAPDAPQVLADPAAAGTEPAVAAAVTGAVAAAYARVAVLSDPRRLAAAAVRADQAAAFAPAWVFLAGAELAAPTVLAGDAQVLTALDAGRRTVLLGSATAVGGVHRDPALLDGWLPPGRLLEEVLLNAAARPDLPAMRRLLAGWSAWVATLPEPAFATADNVLVDGEAFALLDGSRSLAAPVPAGVARLAALRRFAAVLLDGGHPHPWSADRDVDALARTLAAVAGAPADTDLLAAATALDDRLPAEAAPPIGPDAWREQEAALDRLRADLADARARAAFGEAELAAREAELRRLRAQVAAFGPLHRATRATLAAARRAKRLLAK